MLFEHFKENKLFGTYVDWHSREVVQTWTLG